MNVKRHGWLALLVMLMLVGTAACGGDDGTTAGDTPSATDAPTDDPTDEPTEDPCEDQTGDDVVSFEMGDIFFAPECVIANQSQGLHLENTGAAAHTFTITDGDVDFDVAPGQEFNADGPIPLEPDTYTVRCKYHAGMLAELRIEA